MDLSVILTSAAVSATDWAVKHLEQALQIGKDRGVRVQVPVLGWLAQDYYHQLTTLLKRGTLPPEVQQEYDKWLQRSDQAGWVGSHRHATGEAISSSGESRS
jgi:hypothetical protein